MLIAIFVLLVGLLGLIVLVAVGRLSLADAERSDRTGACGRAALNEVKIRNLVDFNQWNTTTWPTWQSTHDYAAGTTVTPTTSNGHYYVCTVGGTSGGGGEPSWPTDGSTTTDGGVTWRDYGVGAPPFAIDPLALFRTSPLPNSIGGAIPRINLWRPWQASSAYAVGTVVLPTTYNGHGYRCTIAGTSSGTEPSWPTNGSTIVDNGATWLDIGNPVEGLFYSHDDLIFTLPENEKPPTRPAGSRPFAGVLDSNGLPQYNGSTSWFLTLSPIAGEASTPLANRTAYNVDVVVCYGRNFVQGGDGPLGEPPFTAGGVTIVPSGYGSGYGSVSATLSNANDIERRLKPHVAKNQWVMLVGADTSGRAVVQWYRVVNVGTTPSTGYLDLVGPDWPGGASSTATLVVIDGVSGVYSQTVPVE